MANSTYVCIFNFLLRTWFPLIKRLREYKATARHHQSIKFKIHSTVLHLLHTNAAILMPLNIMKSLCFMQEEETVCDPVFHCVGNLTQDYTDLCLAKILFCLYCFLIRNNNLNHKKKSLRGIKWQKIQYSYLGSTFTSLLINYNLKLKNKPNFLHKKVMVFPFNGAILERGNTHICHHKISWHVLKGHTSNNPIVSEILQFCSKSSGNNLSGFFA